MKIWIKLLIGILLGIILGFIIPANIDWGYTVHLFNTPIPVFYVPGPKDIEMLSQIAINIGRYVIFPLVFFSLIFGSYELKLEHSRFKTYGLMLLYMLGSTLLLVLIGVITVFIFFQGRIKIVSDNMELIYVPGFKELILTSFPKNLFNVFNDQGDLLLPIVILALIFGMNLTFDKVITRPVVQFVDALSKIFYHINSFVTEIFAVGLIFITTSSILTLRTVQNFSIYTQLVVILMIDVGIVLFGIFPGMMYLLGEKENPYKWLYSITAPLLTAFTTGDAYVSLGMLIKHGKENMGVPRKIGSISYPIYALFGKGGSALVASVSYIVILKSTSSLDISILDVLWVIGMSFLVSFILSSVPGTSAFVAIALLWRASNNPAQESFLMFKAIAPLLIGFGVILDVATSAFVSFLITRQQGIKLKIEARDFI